MFAKQRLIASSLCNLVAPVLACLFLLLLGRTLYVFLFVDRGMVLYDLGPEPARIASTLFFEKMTAIAQVTIALFGATWALLLLPDVRTKVAGWQAVTCFALANLSFGLSLLVYALGYDFIVARVFHHHTFDLDAPFILGISNCQQYSFLFGCVSLVATILIGRRSP